MGEVWMVLNFGQLKSTGGGKGGGRGGVDLNEHW